MSQYANSQLMIDVRMMNIHKCADSDVSENLGHSLGMISLGISIFGYTN